MTDKEQEFINIVNKGLNLLSLSSLNKEEIERMIKRLRESEYNIE